MRKPDQSLDDYIVRPVPEIVSEPPRSVSLQPTGEVEVLKPLTRPKARAKSARNAFRAVRPYQPLWFRRSLAVGSGALVFMALVLVSAILVSINDPAVGPDAVTNGKPDDKLTQPEEPFSFDVFSPSTFARATGRVGIVQSGTSRRPTQRPSIHVAANKPRRQLRRLPQPEHPKFVPTTLVIYAQNGVIYTRIEPWFQDGDKKTQTLNN